VLITLVDISTMMLAKVRDLLAAGGARFQFTILDIARHPSSDATMRLSRRSPSTT
jgi:hypothetical protein